MKCKIILSRSRIRCRSDRGFGSSADGHWCGGKGGPEGWKIVLPTNLGNGGSHLKLVNFLCDLHFILHNIRYTFDAGFTLVHAFSVRRTTDDSVSPATRFNLHSVYTTAAVDMPLVRSHPTTAVAAADTTSLSVGDFIFRTRFSKRFGPRGHRRWTSRRRLRHRLHRGAVHSSRRANSSGTK